MTAEEGKVSIISAVEYDEIVAEIIFPGKFGLILSRENDEEDFELSVHSFLPTAADDFDATKNVPQAKVRLREFRRILDAAEARYRSLSKIDQGQN